MASKRDVSKEQNERHKRILKVMLKKEENRFCADCNSRGPTWASTNLGVFVCLQCSGIHRSLGVHISVVRSTNLDTWLPEQIAFIQRMDNVKANSYWEANLPRDFRRPKDTEQSKLERFIQEKYVSQNFRDRDMPPPTIKNFNDHPLTAADNSSPLPTPAPTSSSSSLASPQTAAAAPRPAPSAAAAAAAKPEPPVQMMADLLSLDDDPPAPPPPAPVAPQVVSENGNGWAEFTSAGDNSSDPFGSSAPPPSSAVTSAQPPADPFAQPATEAPSGNTAQAQNSESNDPFSAFATAPPNTGESGAAVEAQTSKAASNKLSNDDILALFDAAPAANSFGYPPMGQQPASGYVGYGMQQGIPTPQQQQQQYAVQNGNGYYAQPGGMHGQGYAQMSPQQQAYMMQQQQQHAYMMKQQQQYGAGPGYQQGGFMQQHAGYGMPGQQPGMQWGHHQFPQPAAAGAAVPQPAAQQHFAEFASFQ